MKLDAIGFGSLNLDEFWEVPESFLLRHGLETGREYVRDSHWFQEVYPLLREEGVLKAVDPGGSAANMIAALRRMGFVTGFFGSCGNDGLESLRLNELGDRPNLRVEIADAPTGRCLCLINSEDENRDRCLVILPNANDLAGGSHLDLSYFLNARCIHMTSFVSRQPLEVQKQLVQRLPDSSRISFDPGAVYSGLGMDALRPILQRSNALFTTEEEIAALTGCQEVEKSVAVLLEMGSIETIIMKLGSRGLQAITGHGIFHQAAVRPMRIVDRTGAGDVAAAGFLAGVLMDLGVQECLELAAKAASKSIEGYGRSTYPGRDLIDSFQPGEASRV